MGCHHDTHLASVATRKQVCIYHSPGRFSSRLSTDPGVRIGANLYHDIRPTKEHQFQIIIRAAGLIHSNHTVLHVHLEPAATLKSQALGPASHSTNLPSHRSNLLASLTLKTFQYLHRFLTDSERRSSMCNFDLPLSDGTEVILTDRST